MCNGSSAQDKPIMQDDVWFSIVHDGNTETLRTMEWLLPDGVGGYAMGTALGIATRRYHGYYIFAKHQPLGRVMGLNVIDERVIIESEDGETEYAISTFDFEPGVWSPKGFEYLVRFEKGAEFCRWYYQLTDTLQLIRELRMCWRGDSDQTETDVNAGGIAISYRLVGSAGTTARVKLKPLVRLRNHHDLSHAHDHTMSVKAIVDGLRITGSEGEILVVSSDCQSNIQKESWYNFRYEIDRERGQDYREDLVCPGTFTATIKSGKYYDSRGNTASDASQCMLRIGESRAQVTASFMPNKRAIHLNKIATNLSDTSPSLADNISLLGAADDFIVPRSKGDESFKTILAGYPWFADWGRDTAISLPGLLLSTRRFDDAYSVLCAFAANLKDGLIPNCFDDRGGGAHYNTVDASLWFCHAACEYYTQSGDSEGFYDVLKPAILSILQHYWDGTDFGICVDPSDGLVIAGDASTQLTWMDAKRDGVVFTPRFGKPIEINALWYHALRSISEMLIDDDIVIATKWGEIADYVGPNLRAQFWCVDTACLADVLVPDVETQRWYQDQSIRPNQLFAVSLKYSALSIEQQQSVVAVCERDLVTPMGIRALSPSDDRYCGRFEGDMFSRDSSYHQGTVWPWLMGPFVEALLRSESFSSESIIRAQCYIDPLINEFNAPKSIALRHRSLGSVYEVYDGDDAPPDYPQGPGGCTAQAWSVAELIRCMGLVAK